MIAYLVKYGGAQKTKQSRTPCDSYKYTGCVRCGGFNRQLYGDQEKRGAY